MLLYGSNQLTMRDALQAIFRRRWLVLSVFVVTLLPIAYVTLTAPKVYQASSKVLLRRDDRPGALHPYSPRLTQEEEIKSEVEVAASRPVIARVWQAEFAAGAERFDGNRNAEAVSDPSEFEQSRRSGKGNNGWKHWRNTIVSLLPWPQPANTAHVISREEAINAVRDRMSVAMVPGSNVIEISYQDTLAGRAARVANALATSYANYTDEVHGGKEVEQLLGERIRKTKATLDSLENKLQSYRVANEMISYGKQESMLLDKYKSFDYQIDQKREEIAVMEKKIAALAQLERFDAGEALTIPTNEIDAHPTVRRLYERLIDLRIERQRLASVYDERYQLLTDLDQQILSVSEQLHLEVTRLSALQKEQLAALRREERVLAGVLAEQQASLRSYPGKQRVLNELEIALDNTRKVYSMLVLREEELRVGKATSASISRVAIISPASAPLAPVSPKVTRNLAIGTALALLFSLAAGLLREFYDGSFKSPQELKTVLNVPVLATISSAQATSAMRLSGGFKIASYRNGHHAAKGLLNGSANGYHHLLPGNNADEIATAPASSRAFGSNLHSQERSEEFDLPLRPEDAPAVSFCGQQLSRGEIEKLHSEIMMLRRSAGTQIIGFASAQKGEGTSTILANLAELLKHTDLRVLLVDLNFNNPSLAAMYGLPNERGLVDVVRWRSQMLTVTVPIKPGRLFLLPFGKTHDAVVFDALSTARHFLSAARRSNHCDLILVDLPPLRECAQTLQVAQELDGIIQVVETERTRAEVAYSLKQEMDRLGVRVLGAILNRRKYYIPQSIYRYL